MTATAPTGPLDDVTCLHAALLAISGPDGDLREGGVHGFYARDVRLINQLELSVDGVAPRPLAGGLIGSSRAEFRSHVPMSDDHGVDPTMLVTRRRAVRSSFRETVTLRNLGSTPRTVTLDVHVGSDLAHIFDVKRARPTPSRRPERSSGGLVYRDDDGRPGVFVRPRPSPDITGDRLRWRLRLEAGASTVVELEIATADDPAPLIDTPEDRTGDEDDGGSHPQVRCSDDRFTRLLRRSAMDLRDLTLTDPEDPRDRFYAAGAPWYLTLFGRDALWSTYMTLPVSLDIAAGTLRALARRQGTRTDPAAEEEPGKIVHEVRTGPLAERGPLPSRYYGTVDATPLFVLLLHEAWLWGLPDEIVVPLLPNLEAALGWMRDHGRQHGEGFLGYASSGTRSLRNQGWKDSDDGIRFADGRIAEPPIALLEVQGYAYDAAVRGAELLERFDRAGADGWRSWAGDLRERFHERFWVQDEAGPYLALALDGDGVPVDAPASNMGHVLASGLLDPEQASIVARRLADPSLSSGWGLRTMSTDVVGYNPLSYHGGSVWPHDTAIAAWGCAVAGEDEVAAQLVGALVAAGPHFDDRLPELFGGFARSPGSAPVPYPAACRPQAWSASAAWLLLRACLRPQPRIPDGALSFDPLRPPPFRRLQVRGLPAHRGTLDLVFDAERGPDHQLRGADLDVRWEVGR